VPSASRLPGALRHRNFQLFISGQFISLSGTWMQTLALGWLVLQLTNSAFKVGLVAALGSLPILFFTLYGGVVADRVNKRPALVLLQSLMLLEALTIATLTHWGWVTVSWVMALAALLGTLSAFEVPIRQAFIVDMVGTDDLMNAIALNASVFNLTRILGPALAGVMIAAVGLAACFYFNAASYLAVIVGLLLMRFPGQAPRPAGHASTVGFGAGLQYAKGDAGARRLLLQTALFSVFGFSFIPMLPVLARDVLNSNAAGYGGLMSSVGLGATVGGLAMAAAGHRFRRTLLLRSSGVLFGFAVIGVGLVPRYWAAALLLAIAGCTMVLNNVVTNTFLQTTTPDSLRGRIMGYYSLMVLGMAPLGAFQAGFVSEHWGVRTALMVGGAFCLLGTLRLGWRVGEEEMSRVRVTA
jgi:MFS family permease